MLDVGQGDATLLEFPGGEAMLVDGGGFVGGSLDTGRRVLLPVLRARRRRRLDVVALSHPHPDHFSGLQSLVEQCEVGEFWDTGQGEREGAGPLYAKLLKTLRSRGVRVRRPDELCGQPRTFGGARVEVLGPCPTFVPGRPANDNSLVLRIDHGQRSFLLVGDAEQAQETELLASGASLGADVLKVGHHGSRTSTSPEFLAQVGPRFATLSCGVRNRFGHPDPQTLANLRHAGTLALRLDRMGQVEFVSDGSLLRVRAFSLPY
jgi:competence protein ComEC